MPKKVAVVAVPFITSDFHFTIAARTVLSLLSNRTEHELYLIGVVNRCANSYHLQWFEKSFDHFEINDKNILARAWNKGIQRGFAWGADYVLVINLDLIFHSQFVDNIVRFAEANKNHLIWSGINWADDNTLESAPLKDQTTPELHMSCFMIDPKLPQKIGYFDENFEPAYHEDSDMLYRIRMAGGTSLSTHSALFHHIDRVTLKGIMQDKDHALLDAIRVQMDSSMEYYEKKWGGLPNKEKFRKPFNAS